MFEVKDLSFSPNALEPYMSSKTFEFHHGKHYKAYVDKLNELIQNTEYANMSLTEIIKKSFSSSKDKAIYNNAGQVWNHEFFWSSLTAEKSRKPSDKLMKEIERDFITYDDFKKEFKNKSLAQFGSGWTWLVRKDGRLQIVTTSNADNPVSLDLGEPIICLDVWEHAYYLDYQNKRGDFADAFLDYMVKL